MVRTDHSTRHLIERISALHRNLIRRSAVEHDLQFVHVEILQYLLMCNRYSNTNQALSEFLGQTKGSISQSLSHLEKRGFVLRSQDKKDKRVFHLVILSKGIHLVESLNARTAVDDSKEMKQVLRSILLTFQKKNNMRSFGICSSCKFNQNLGKNNFVCGLTKETLTLEDIKKICREHEINS